MEHDPRTGAATSRPPMPYEPSAPCARCARGVDPLRAACVAVADQGTLYFCSRACRESYVRAEAQHRIKVASQPDVRAVRLESPTARASSLEPVARRVAPGRATTPVWPLFSSLFCVLLGFLPQPESGSLAALGLMVVAGVFASRSVLTRRHAGITAWVAAPLAVTLLALSTLLPEGRTWLGLGARHGYAIAAALGVLVMWLREHLSERERALHDALRSELEARVSSRVRVSTAPPPRVGKNDAAQEQISERSLSSLQVGDEVIAESGSVLPVDGLVLSGSADVLPYPRARQELARGPGSVVLGGALVTRGSLRVRATQVGPQRALFGVFADRARSEPASVGLALAQRARSIELGLLSVGAALVVALLAPSSLGDKLAGLGAALLAIPAFALAQGIEHAYRRVRIAASARGVHYREPASLERAGRLDTAVLRVEGTLVPRSYTLVEVETLSDTHTANELLALALAAELAAGPHAIASAVREHAEALGIEPAILRRVVLAHGQGITGLTDGQGSLVFGSRAALLSAGVSVAVADRAAQRAEQLGQRVVFLALGGRARGLFVFSQAVRTEARVALQTLFDLGLEVELVSGDHRTTVESIARTLDIMQVKAELSSEQRAAEVRRLRDGEAQVVALGRIPEDEALLAAADLSLCIDGAGRAGEHDVLYDITTASPDLRDAVAALTLARALQSDVRRVWLISAVIGAVALFAALGALPAWLVVLLALAADSACLSAAAFLRGGAMALSSRREVSSTSSH